MPLITGTDFLALLKDSSSTVTEGEKVLDQTIDLINGFASVDLPNLTGTAGSKSLNVEGRQRGIIYFAARSVYASMLMNAANKNAVIGSLSVTSGDLLSNPSVLDSIKEAARQLSETDWSKAII